jgi:hypothetical protein
MKDFYDPASLDDLDDLDDLYGKFNALRERHPELDAAFEKACSRMVKAQASPSDETYWDAISALGVLAHKLPENRRVIEQIEQDFKDELLETLLDHIVQWSDPKRKVAFRYVFTDAGKARQFINREEGYVYQIYVQPGDTEEQFKALEPFIARLVPEPWTRLLNGLSDNTVEHMREFSDEELGDL